MSAKKIENLKVGDKIRIIKMYGGDNSKYNGDVVVVTNVGNHYPEIFSCNEIEDPVDTESDECERVKAAKKPLLKRFKNNTLVKITKNDKYPETGYPSRYYEKSIGLVGYTQHNYNNHYYTLWSKQDGKGEYYGFFVRSELEEIKQEGYPKCKFKVGDKVINIETGDIDTVKSIPGDEEYDRVNYCNASMGFDTIDHSWNLQADWKLAPQPTPIKFKRYSEIKATEDISQKELMDITDKLGQNASDSLDKIWFDAYNTFTNNINNSKKGGIMSYIRSIPARIKKLLNSNFKSFYSLGWVDEELNITSAGRTALIDVIFDKFEKELGVAASTEVKRLKKLEKKEAK